MISLVPFLTSLLVLTGSSFTARALRAHDARARALITMGIAVTFVTLLECIGSSLLPLRFEVLGVDAQVTAPGLLNLTTFVTCVLGLIAVAMSPVTNHSRRTFFHITLLIATALGFLAVRNAALLSVLWAFSSWVAWLELRALPEPGTARLFAVYHTSSVVSFSFGTLLLSGEHRELGLSLLALGIAIREGIIPVHSWFPRFVEKAPLGLVVAFAAPQLGVYAHLEVLSDVFPSNLAHHVAAIGATTALLAAGLGAVQSKARRAVAFLMMSQTGLVAFGLQNDSVVATSGALLAWQVLALAMGGLVMTLAALEARRGSLTLHRPSGNFSRTPRMGVAFLLLGFASVGFPATLGFVAEDLLVQGSIDEFPALGLALIVATAINGITVARCSFLLFFGTREHRGELDFTTRETWAVTLVLSLLLAGGALPGPILTLQDDVPTSPIDPISR